MGFQRVKIELVNAIVMHLYDKSHSRQPLLTSLVQYAPL